jgi:hypothetical protein
MVIISMGAGMIGAVLLVTSTILYTLTALPRVRIKDV